MPNKNLEKREEVLTELQKHEAHGATVVEISTLIISNPKTVSKWLHRLENEKLAWSIRHGNVNVYYPITGGQN